MKPILFFHIKNGNKPKPKPKPNPNPNRGNGNRPNKPKPKPKPKPPQRRPEDYEDDGLLGITLNKPNGVVADVSQHFFD